MKIWDMMKIELKQILIASKMILYSIKDDTLTVKGILHDLLRKIKP